MGCGYSLSRPSDCASKLLFEIHATSLVSDYLEEKNDFYEGVCKKQEQDRSARKLLVADLAILEAHEMGIDWFAFLAAQLQPKKNVELMVTCWKKVVKHEQNPGWG